MSAHVVVLLSKVPCSGLSKRRIAQDLGDQVASALAESMLADSMLSLAGSLRQGQEISLVWFFFPPRYENHAHELLVKYGLVTKWSLISNNHNSGASIGTLLHHLYSMFSSSSHPMTQTITFLGADCPHIASCEILNGIDTALSGQAFILPASDGGYVMITLPIKRKECRLFENISWSSSVTLQDQLKALENAGLDYTLGKEYRDLDTVEDLIAFKADILPSVENDIGRRPYCPNTAIVLQSLLLM